MKTLRILKPKSSCRVSHPGRSGICKPAMDEECFLVTALAKNAASYPIKLKRELREQGSSITCSSRCLIPVCGPFESRPCKQPGNALVEQGSQISAALSCFNQSKRSKQQPCKSEWLQEPSQSSQHLWRSTSKTLLSTCKVGSSCCIAKLIASCVTFRCRQIVSCFSGRSVDEVLQTTARNLSVYASIESELLQQKARILGKIPDIRKSLGVVELLLKNQAEGEQVPCILHATTCLAR